MRPQGNRKRERPAPRRSRMSKWPWDDMSASVLSVLHYRRPTSSCAFRLCGLVPPTRSLGSLDTRFSRVLCSTKLPYDDDAAIWLRWMTTAATVCHAPSPPPLKHASQRLKLKTWPPVQVLQKQVHGRTNRRCWQWCESVSPSPKPSFDCSAWRAYVPLGTACGRVTTILGDKVGRRGKAHCNSVVGYLQTSMIAWYGREHLPAACFGSSSSLSSYVRT
ncbi:hypothetical protein LY76DRAFT_41386 [Colletotrichum caudatum]|nr:hypothetical protein LY76DRAFT_41386 [Colletotrichum caudatum]